MNHPANTYRIQFNKHFTFADFRRVKEYFKQLGVDTIYASPIFEAVPGSVHGYDVTDPLKINPEIGDEKSLHQLSAWLKEENMHWLQDIVPNHMAFHPKNKWLMDVLEKGSRSLYQIYFDSVFTCPAMNGKIMVPFLGEKLEEAIDQGLIEVMWDGERLGLSYFKNIYPLKPSSYLPFLQRLRQQDLVEELSRLEDVGSPQLYHKNWSDILKKIGLRLNNVQVKNKLEGLLQANNQKKGVINDIVHAQHYELCHWEETNHRINFRRFFTVNGLICLNMKEEEVFEQYHQLIKKMLEQGIFDGLRIDHIDGLHEPTTYLKRLRELAGKDTYIIAEKILEVKEELPAQWPIQGNTGYDFLGMVNNLLTLKSSAGWFDDFYHQLHPNHKSVEEEVLSKKRYILESNMQGELENLYQYFLQLRLSRKIFPKERLKKAIGALLINSPVYRLYSETYPFATNEFEEFLQVFQSIKEQEDTFQEELEELEQVLLHSPQQHPQVLKNKAAISFFKRCMQFSGPLMAKGVEDTLMYTYFKFIGHNEVGDHPSSFGLKPDEFHELMKRRQEESPLSINTTATHDTKRGEDARARLNVLTALPEEWFDKVKSWQEMNAKKREGLAIDVHEEYFIYQNILGHYPMPGMEDDDFEERLKAYLQKAFREGKLYSDWANPDTSYEERIFHYVSYLLNPEHPFLNDFKDYHQRIALYGMYNSLVQLVLKFTCPGIPDVYQGGECWDFSFVDPDNRRKVDYDWRMKRLEQMEQLETPGNIQLLLSDYGSGAIKLWLTHQLLNLRKEKDQLFISGDYLPLKVEGIHQHHILAFIRELQQQKYLVITLLHLSTLIEEQQVKLTDLNWKDTQVKLPYTASWFNILQLNEGEGSQLLLNDLNLQMPFAILKLEDKANTRNAGVLMHITSLPSDYGIGDLGPGAFRFVDFLKRSGQRYWQLMPISPTGKEEHFSPYSSLCTMAGDPLLISPEVLMEDDLLDQEDLKEFQQPSTDKVDYIAASVKKFDLLDKAWQKALSREEDPGWIQFCKEEYFWLDDFAMFMVLKEKFDRPWYQWPQDIKSRAKEILAKLSEAHQDELKKHKWFQYQFEKQWKAFKTYSNQHQVHLIGDLPFYVNHNSSDVWAHQHIFKLDADGAIAGIAGVPPDYFSADGQLWGMPVYKWPVLKKQYYAWWMLRLSQNMRWFNLLRLDHFRAFYDYWEVPGGERTAVNGCWCSGPGADFFKAVEAEFPHLPFIAEDLGQVSPEIFHLRDEFKLPGMKVLQFAFGADMAGSTHIPHQYERNFVVYTGTHDNNTTKGWFKNDLDEKGKEHLSAYFNRELKEEEVAGALIRAAYASVAKIVIIPIQDILNLDQEHRSNTPGTTAGNWVFRLSPQSLAVEKQLYPDEKIEKKLLYLVYTYGRG